MLIKEGVMVSIVFSMDGKKFDVQEFIKQSKWKVNSLWIKGKKMPIGERISPSSGLKMDICEFSTFEIGEDLIKKKIIAFITNNHQIFSRLRTDRSVRYGIDVSFISGWAGYFCLGINLDNELVGILSKNKIQLTFSVYFGGRKKGMRILS